MKIMKPMSTFSYSDSFITVCPEIVCLCLTSLQQHLETAPPFTVPCEGHEAR